MSSLLLPEVRPPLTPETPLFSLGGLVAFELAELGEHWEQTVSPGGGACVSHTWSLHPPNSFLLRQEIDGLQARQLQLGSCLYFLRQEVGELQARHL